MNSSTSDSTGKTRRTFSRRVQLLARRLWPAVADLASTDVYVLASAIAFNALLSFFPFVVLLLVFCRTVLDWPQGYEAVLRLLHDAYLPVANDFIVQNLRVVTGQYGQGGALVLVSLGTLAFTSAGIFTPIEQALNRAWKVGQARSFLRSQGLALLLVFGCGLLALGAVFLAANVYRFLEAVFGVGIVARLSAATVSKLLNLPATIGIFFLIYYCLPNRRVPAWRVLPAAVYVGTFWEVARHFFVWCLPILNFKKMYGPFYVTVTLVMWAFISALLLLLGANLSTVEEKDEA